MMTYAREQESSLSRFLAQCVAIVRCKTIGPIERAQAQRFKDAGLSTVIYAVNMPETVAGSDDSYLPVTATSVARLGITGLPPHWAWLCGDVCLYLAQERYPDAQYFFLVEDDVVFTGRALEQALCAAASSGAAAIAGQLVTHEKTRRYSRPLIHLGYPATLGCIFPFIFVARRVVEKMQELRQKCGTLQLVPNDEAILAACLFEEKFPSAAWEQLLPEIFARHTFHTNPPHLRDSVIATQGSHCFHPALPFETILSRLNDPMRHYPPRRLRNVFQTASPEQHAQLMQHFSALEAARATSPAPALPA